MIRLKINLRKYSTIDALKTSTVGELLPRYSTIILNDMPAKFQITKRILVEFDKNMTSVEMWKLHNMLMKKFSQTQFVIDKGKLDISELDIPRFSLLDLKIKLVEDMLKSCDLCEHKCGSNRTKGETGKCKVADTNNFTIASESIHFGEEPHITPSHTIFMMGCNFNCQFCQNSEISQWKVNGTKLTPHMVADAVKEKSKEGARNVNWVGGEPTPHLLAILKALKAIDVNTPQIWNSNFYMSKKTMAILDGVVDMYLSDFKYGNDECAHVISKIDNYFEVVSRNHLLATKQSELTLRHLVLPEHVECCTKPVLDWIAKTIRTKTLVNVMGQYYPAYNANEFMDLRRKVNEEEMKEAFNYAEKLNLFYMS